MAENHDHHIQSGLIAFLGSLSFVFIFFFYIVFINKGVTLNENVSEPTAKDAPKFDLARVQDPWVSNDQVVTAGAKIFKQNCALCHGAKGDLVGGVPNARHLVNGQWKAGEGIINHFKVLQNGIAGSQMVSFKETLKPYERWAVLHYIELITNNKSKDKTEDIATFAKSAD